jgi:hypothetical protein
MLMSGLFVKRVLLVCCFIDLRKGHLGLLGICRHLGYEPWSGDLLVFVSKDKTKIKLLVADETGLWVLYKQFSKGVLKTKLRFLQDETTTEISQAELGMLLAGHDYTIHKVKQSWTPSPLFPS